MDTEHQPPARRAYSRQEITDEAKAWMILNYGMPKDLDADARDRWHEKLGLLYDFLTDSFPAA